MGLQKVRGLLRTGKKLDEPTETVGRKYRLSTTDNDNKLVFVCFVLVLFYSDSIGYMFNRNYSSSLNFDLSLGEWYVEQCSPTILSTDTELQISINHRSPTATHLLLLSNLL